MSRASHGSDRLSITAALVVLVFVLIYTAIGYVTLDPGSRAVPSLAALVTAGLLTIEIAKMRRHAQTRRPADANRANEWLVIGSVIGATFAIWLVGFLVAIPLYIAFAVWIIGRRPLPIALAAAVLTTVVIYVAFELILSFRLFGGVVF